MKHFKQHTKLLYLLLLGSGALTAQTSNYGVFVVAPNTVFSNEQSFTNNTTASVINDGDTYLYGDLINNSTLDYTANGNGTVRFVSSAPQNIAGSVVCYFNNVAFNNTSPGLDNIRLNNSIFVANEGNFTDGIVNIDDNTGDVFFENNSFTTDVNNQSFVDGVVIKVGDSDFEFPIGDVSFFRPAGISGPNSNAASFTAKYFLEDPDPNYPRASKIGDITIVDDNEYWVVENTSGNEQVFITLSWDAQTTPAEIRAQPVSAIRVIRWNQQLQLWENVGGVVDAVNKTVTTLATLDTFGVFTLGRINPENTLPTGESIFNAISANNDGVNDYFLISNIQDYPNNTVEIFNRWGAKVFSTQNYDSTDNVFRGMRDGSSIDSNDKYLPTGTYFYVIEYDFINENGLKRRVNKAGYLYLNSD